jgi:diguanylate cyclase (GGDEF)-like protein
MDRTEPRLSFEADIEFIGGYQKAPPRDLRFPLRLERRYLVERGAKNAASFYLIAVFLVISLILVLGSMMLAGMVAARRAIEVYLEVVIPAVLPILGATAYWRRFPRALIWYDTLLVVECAGTMLGFILVNREITPPVAIYHAFAMSLAPLVFNLLMGLRFAYAAPMCLYYIALPLGSALLRPDFPVDAQLFLGACYIFLPVGSLFATYRVEYAERVNFLRSWKDNLRNVEIERANRHLDTLARTDGLTGLANRREFDARFAAEAARARAEAKSLTLIVLDIDHFKLYNDRLGHPQGDKCIRVVARAIVESIGAAPNFAGRIGGEEFAAVLPGAAVEEAAATAHKIRSAVEAMQLPHPALGDRRVVSISLGVAYTNPARPETPEALMARADAALYRAKRAGRDRAEVDLRVVGT